MMKYILLNDLNYILKEKKKILIFYFSLILSYFVLNIITCNCISNELVYKSLALNCNLKLDGWMEILIFCFSQCIYIYITLQLFYKDLKFGIDNIYLRMKSSNWIYYKMISIYFITNLVLSVMYIFFSIVFIVKNITLNLNIYIFITNLIYVFCVETIMLLCVFISKIFKIIIPLLILVSLLIMMNILTDILSLNLLFLLIILLFIDFIVLIFYRKFYISVNENS